MKLLFDDNLSPRLVSLLTKDFPASFHLRDVGLKASTDQSIWEWAKENSALICTKDSDFYHLAILQGPPKVIWLKIGNASTTEAARELRENVDAIRKFAEAKEQNVLILGNET